jgi:hypothetical protein
MWDLTTSRVRKCTGGVLSSQAKISGVHQYTIILGIEPA